MAASGRPNWMLHSFLIATSLSVAVYFGVPFSKHVAKLWSHAWSGDWTATSRNKALQSYVKQYESSEWSIHYTAGTPYAFPFDEGSRHDTIAFIGQRIPVDGETLAFKGSTLPDIYRSFLIDQRIALGARIGAEQQPAWGRFIEFLDSELGRMTLDERHIARRSAEQLLESLTVDSELPRALLKFNEHSDSPLAEDRAFDVSTDPPYDAINDRRELAVANLDQESRCHADVIGRLGNVRVANATISVVPQIMELQLKREWLSEAMLKKRKSLPSEFRVKYFGTSGELRLIPDRLILGVGNQVRISPNRKSDFEVISNLVSKNDCCKLQCGELLSVTLLPGVEHGSGNTFVGVSQQESPLVEAIVSRRHD